MDRRSTMRNRKRHAFYFTAALKACAQKKDLDQLSLIHAEIRNSGLLQENTYLGNTLVSMYAKCGALTKARKLVHELPARNVVSWNVLIAAYAQHGRGKEALACLQQMRNEGLSPNAVTYACTLKSCGITQDVNMGERIHDEIASQGLLEKHVMLGGALVDMYAKCNILTKARKVLDELPVRNIVSWSALIAGYVQHGCGKEALSCFEQMQIEGHSPNAITYASTLKACGITQDVDMGEKIHDEIARQGLLEKHVVLGGALVDMYVKCAILMRAQKVLDELPVRNVECWNALIVGYAQHDFGKEALRCFQQMLKEGLSPDGITYACAFKACAIIEDVDTGERIHDEIASQGLLEKDVLLACALVDMYAKCGALAKARKVFYELPVRNVACWNALISGYAQHGLGKEALVCFQHMQSEGLSLDEITYACALKACGITQDLDMGERIHNEIASQRLLEKHVVLGSALVDMYVKFGALAKAQKVFDELSVQNVVSWNALIAGYAQHDCGKAALGCFQQMQRAGPSPDSVTYACALNACGIVQDADMGERIHDEIASQGMLKKDVLLGCALIDMYAKCGALMKAQKVFNELPVPNVACWNALISGYAQQGCGKEALGCFQQMQSEGLALDEFTYAYALKACGITQDINTGEKIHNEIASQGLIEKHVALGSALIDMYAKCDILTKAQKVHDELLNRNDVTWSALVAGYAHKGRGQEALSCFQQMQQEGTSPSAITFVCLLNACSHSGLVDEGQMLFDSMREKYRILPQKEHFTCMVDLFGRARHFDKAMRVIEMMPSADWPPVWSALLGACRKWGNVELGRLAFERAVELDKCDAAVYVLMSNIYAAAGMQEEVQSIERMRVRSGAWKPGHSCWTDASGNVH